MKKGDIVLVKARVDTQYHALVGEVIYTPQGVTYAREQKKLLVRYEEKEPWQGMVVGYSFLQTGWRSYDIDEYPYLRSDKYHRVWLIEPFGSERWAKPISCLEADLTPIENQRGA